MQEKMTKTMRNKALLVILSLGLGGCAGLNTAQVDATTQEIVTTTQEIVIKDDAEEQIIRHDTRRLIFNEPSCRWSYIDENNVLRAVIITDDNKLRYLDSGKIKYIDPKSIQIIFEK